MNPNNFFSKTMSVVAGLALTFAGSLASAPAAHAALTNTGAPVVSGTPTVGYTLTTNNGTWNEVSTMVMYTWLRCDSSITSQQKSGGINPSGCVGIMGAYSGSYTLVSADLGKHIASIVSYQSSSGTVQWISASRGAVSAQQSATYTNTVAATFAMSNGIATYTPGTWTASDSSTPTVSFLWLFCDSSHNADSGSSGGPAADCGPIAATDISGTSPSSNSWIKTNPLSLPATAFKWVNSNGGIVTVASASLTTKHIAVYESVNGNWKVSATAAVTETAQASTEQVTRSVERSIPTSVFQAPILNSLAPKMTGGFSSTGGRLVMKDVKPADISSVMLNGKKVEVIASKSGSALRIPAGAGAGDLTFTMADGTVLTVANAVKITPSQVDPKLVDLNPLPTFKAGSVAVPAAIKSALNKRKAIILDSASAKCVGYASSNTAAARATALSRASNVCGVITDINENIEPIVKVLVNKTVAKKSPVKYQTW